MLYFDLRQPINLGARISIKLFSCKWVFAEFESSGRIFQHVVNSVVSARLPYKQMEAL